MSGPIRRITPSEKVYVLRGTPYVCAYCGEPADNVEHTVPIWFTEGNTELIRRYKFLKVWSCCLCNKFAGKKVDSTFIQRRRRIAAKLRKKYRKVLGTADWTPEELAELGPNLQAYCNQSSQLQIDLLRRLRYLDFPLPPEDVPNELFLPHENVYDMEAAEKMVAAD